MLDPAPPDSGEKEQYRYPYIACEVLSSEITQSKNVLMNERCLSLLFSAMESQQILQAPRAPYISKVFHELLCHHGNEVCVALSNHLNLFIYFSLCSFISNSFSPLDLTVF